MNSIIQTCKPTFPLHIVIDAPRLKQEEAQHIVRATQHALDDLNEFSAHHLRLTLGACLNESSQWEAQTSQQRGTSNLQSVADLDNEEVALQVNLQPSEGATAVAVDLRPHSNVLVALYPASQVITSSSSSAVASTIVTFLQDIFAEEQASIAHTLSSSPYSSSVNGQTSKGRETRNGISKIISPELAEKLDRRTTRAVTYAPLYHITISLVTAGASPSSWEIDQAVREYLSPLLSSLSISKFTVDTQVQLYASFSPSVQTPEYDAQAEKWTLRIEDLSSFINAAEWPLGPSMGKGSTIHFIIYVPDKDMSPLVVKESYATSWLIPRWGGITILNLPTSNISSTPNHLSKQDIRPALLTISHQLMSLLGAPESPASFPLQLQTLIRVRAASLLLSASATMGSLARLTVALPSIAIPETVAMAVDKTMTHLTETCKNLNEGRFNAALEHARIAEAEAEKGFFEKSMVGQVYFPDEHKIAVYLPFLGPVMFPLLLAGLKELKRLSDARKTRRKAVG